MALVADTSLCMSFTYYVATDQGLIRENFNRYSAL
uniref:Uncharacterized protein n=1 Tax=Arundo donax TaxID=35708 RepID=A0A0A9CLX8_ARUDO